VKIETTNHQSRITVATKVESIGMDEVAAALEVGYMKLMAYVTEQEKQITGAPYCCYMNASEDFSQFDMELGIPINEAVAEKDDIYMSQTYGGRAISATYQGPYKTLDAAYAALLEYAKEHAVELTGIYYDYYISDPTDTPESELLTQVVFSIK